MCVKVGILIKFYFFSGICLPGFIYNRRKKIVIVLNYFQKLVLIGDALMLKIGLSISIINVAFIAINQYLQIL